MRVVTVARKPCPGTTTTNVAEHGAGALNVGACRIPYLSEDDKTPSVGTGEFRREPGVGTTLPQHKEGWGQWSVNHAGRWPANVVLAGQPVAAAVDEQSGISTSGARGGPVVGGPPRSNHGFKLSETSRDRSSAVMSYGDVGGASRYFKCLD